MRALIQDQFGDPASVLSVREVPLPEPRPERLEGKDGTSGGSEGKPERPEGRP